MTKTLLPLSFLAYLSCATPQATIQVPIVEVQGNSVTIVDKGIRNVAQEQKELPAKKAADFIVKTLEEKITEHPGAVYAYGTIKIDASPHYYEAYYTFHPIKVCEDGSNTFLSKGALFIRFENWESVGNRYYTLYSISFETVKPFYSAERFTYYHERGDGSTKYNYYPAFPEARKMHQELLIYIAEELKHPYNIELHGDVISIHHPDRDLGDQKEENLFKSWVKFIYAFPAHQPYPPGKNITHLVPCKP